MFLCEIPFGRYSTNFWEVVRRQGGGYRFFRQAAEGRSQSELVRTAEHKSANEVSAFAITPLS